MAIESINPATGELIRHYEETAASEIGLRLEKAETTFKEWRKTGFAQRAELMLKAANDLRQKSRKYGELITKEMGKTIKEAVGEVEKCAWVCEFYAQNAEKILGRREVETDAHQSYVRYDPIGPVLAVMPWNFPFWQVYRFAAPALMAGNVGLLKHASNVPACALAIEENFRNAGFPDGAFSTLLISSRTVSIVIEDRRVKAVTLTGSEPAGQQVAASAGKELKKTVLELGGSDPFIVLEDADLKKAGEVAATARLINAGQSCIAAKRFIVVEKALAGFTESFTQALQKKRLGDPMKEDTDVGPMARGDLRDELHEQVERSIKQGAKLVFGGEIPKGAGYYYPVTLLTDVKPGMAAADEETFGPVAPIIPAKNEAEAIDIANDSEFGLGAALWTRDLDKAHILAQRIEAGAVFVNGFVKSDPRLPFGGIKKSGYGRELSEEGIREFMNIKSVWMAK